MNSNIIIIISQGYETRVKLAVLDYNAHLQRNHITKPDGTKLKSILANTENKLRNGMLLLS